METQAFYKIFDQEKLDSSVGPFPCLVPQVVFDINHLSWARFVDMRVLCVVYWHYITWCLGVRVHIYQTVVSCCLLKTPLCDNAWWSCINTGLCVECVCQKESQNAMNSCFQMIYFSSGDWSCASSAWAIWYVPLIVCCKQLLCTFVSFSLVNTTAITFSRWPFHTFHSHLLSLSIQLCGWWGGGVLFNYSHLPARLPESFILQRAGEFTERFGIQPIRKKNMNIDLRKRIFLFPATAVLGSGALSWK